MSRLFSAVIRVHGMTLLSTVVMVHDMTDSTMEIPEVGVLAMDFPEVGVQLPERQEILHLCG